MWSCSESTNEDPPSISESQKYFPLEVGQSMLFDLDSIIYDPEPGGIVVDTLSYELRFEVVDTFLDSENEKAFKIERFVRRSDTMPWRITDVWSAKKTDQQLVWTEENLPFIKLIFPIEVDDRWDGNALFDDDQIRVKVRGETLDMFKFWNRYEATNKGTEMVNGVAYEDALTIVQVDKEISIEKRYVEEVYAPDIGLIYQKIEILDTQDENVARPFDLRAERGFIVELRRK